MTNVDLREKLNREIIIFDGAMGTILQRLGLDSNEVPEILNITHSEEITEIHKSYINAGCNVITTNTFGAGKVKLQNAEYSTDEIIRAAVRNAEKARKGASREIYIALDIGPIGQLLEPMGDLSFEDAYDIFKEQVLCGVEAGADLILIETMTDLSEARAALLAAKENSTLPVFVTMSFQGNGRTFTGCTPVSMAVVLSGMGADAIGINCSLGPEEMKSMVEDILRVSPVPVMIQPNAGIPSVSAGITKFPVATEEFSQCCQELIKKGVTIVGGCCGTDDSYIRLLSSLTENMKPVKRDIIEKSIVCTPSKYLYMDRIRVTGERINPTGREDLKTALKDENIDYILREAILQIENGADILDINLGLPDINQPAMMIKVIKALQAVTDIPLQIDSEKPEVIEAALRVYNGKAIVNSVNGKAHSMEKIFPIVKKYGASVIGLTLDEDGIPSEAGKKFAIAEKIVKTAGKYGIKPEDVYIDCITMTVAAKQKEAMETLKAVSMVKERLKVKTTLGVSNISFGLPLRNLLNRTFLAAALMNGLDLPIINTMDEDMMDTINSARVIRGEDEGALQYADIYSNSIVKEESYREETDNQLYHIIISGFKDEAGKATEKLLKTMEAGEIVDTIIIPALDFMGTRYERGDIFLPQLVQSAETVKISFDVLKKDMCIKSDMCKGKIILATVKGDIHDIGKNIVKVILESYGYEVIDLGKDTSWEIISQCALKNEIKLIGLSALMTSTVTSMEETIKNLRKSCPDSKIMVGGAVLTKEYAERIGADFYAETAQASVSIAEKVFAALLQ